MGSQRSGARIPPGLNCLLNVSVVNATGGVAGFFIGSHRWQHRNTNRYHCMT